MEYIGAIRRVDDVGRILIPREIREYLNIKSKDKIEFKINKNGEIILTPQKTKINTLSKISTEQLIKELISRGEL